MATNKLKKSKLYIGKTFSLRNGIVYFRSGIYKNTDNTHVLVIDENSKSVQVIINGQIDWISKFYLYREIIDSYDNPVAELNQLIDNLRLQTTRLDRMVGVKGNDEKAIIKVKDSLHEIMGKLRGFEQYLK